MKLELLVEMIFLVAVKFLSSMSHEVEYMMILQSLKKAQ